jgi:amino acid permease
MGWIILSIYVIGLIASALIFPRLFPYKEGMWEIFEGEAMPIDEEEHKMNITAMCFLWVFVVAIMVIVLSIKGIEWLAEVV